MLHRPFIERWRPELAFAEPTSNPHEICLEAANRICVILERYLERLLGGPCDMVFTIFTAASILLHCSKKVEAAAAVDVRRRLTQCIHWLSVLGKSWKTAGTHHQLLNDCKPSLLTYTRDPTDSTKYLAYHKHCKNQSLKRYRCLKRMLPSSHYSRGYLWQIC